MKNTKLVIIGDSYFAEVAHEYFRYDSDYEVVAFAVEAAYRKSDELNGLPVVDLEFVDAEYPPSECDAYVALTYSKLNRTRGRIYNATKDKGYVLASYVSSKAFVWRNVEIGENTFIFENNVLQPFVKIGSNTVLWSGNHIGHHSTIGDNVFLASHVVVSGLVVVGDNCFFGVNATVADNIKIGKDCWVGPNTLVGKNLEAGTMIKADNSEAMAFKTYRFFKLPEEPEGQNS